MQPVEVVHKQGKEYVTILSHNIMEKIVLVVTLIHRSVNKRHAG